MPTYTLPPGAWLDASQAGHPSFGFGGAPLTHPDPPGGNRADFLHPDPPGGNRADFLHPDPPGGNRADFTHPDPPRSGSRTAPGRFDPGPSQPANWRGIDPPWVYGGAGQALLATALRKVQAKITRPADPRLAPPGPHLQAAHTEPLDALWRWAPKYRIKTAVNELLGRCVLRDKALWHLDLPLKSGTLVATRYFQITPPDANFNLDTQIDKVVRAAIEREDRLPEILSQLNDTAPFFDAITGLDALTSPHTNELLSVAWEWAQYAILGLKHEVAQRRPAQCSAIVQPVIATPGHGSLPSGHAAIAALMSELLTALLYAPPHPQPHPRAEQLDRLARRIAFNRVVAGVHFPMDSLVGYQLGTALARLMQALATGAKAPAFQSITPTPGLDLPEHGRRAPQSDCGPALAAAPQLARMWQAAQRELAALRV